VHGGPPVIGGADFSQAERGSAGIHSQTLRPESSYETLTPGSSVNLGPMRLKIESYRLIGAVQKSTPVTKPIRVKEPNEGPLRWARAGGVRIRELQRAMFLHERGPEERKSPA
jgi:hypothetical protein